jgi:hypothetical protein
VSIKFEAWPKTPRLFRDIVVTEKVDGTNSAVIIEQIELETYEMDAFTLAIVNRDGFHFAVAAQSRNRLITPGKTTDNHGFAAFVQQNAGQLFDLLGPGRHFGEWWGKGIGKRYVSAMEGIKGFALFNTAKHEGLHEWLTFGDQQVLVEPVRVLYQGPFSEEKIRDTLEELQNDGSWMSPFDPAEGIVVFHTQSRQTYKITLDGNDAGKWEA